MRRLEREYMPAVLRRKYELAEINYALEHIHFPSDEKELLFARRRLVFDGIFHVSCRRQTAEGAQGKRNVFLGLKGMPGGFKTQGKASLCPYRSSGEDFKRGIF